jgi:hypothetical protein
VGGEDVRLRRSGGMRQISWMSDLRPAASHVEARACASSAQAKHLAPRLAEQALGKVPVRHFCHLGPVNRLQEIANPNLAVPFGRSPKRERLHNQPFAGHSMEDNAHPRQA